MSLGTTALLLLFGIFVGLTTVAQGWHGKTTLGGFIVWTVGQLGQLVTRQSDVAEFAKRLSSAADMWHVREAAYWLGWGAIGSGVGLLVIGSVSIFALEYARQRQQGWLDAVGLAGYRAGQYLTHGLRAYLSTYSAGALEALRISNTRRAVFGEFVIAASCKTIARGDRRRNVVSEQIANVGRTMLLLLFERDQTVLRDFRLAVYLVSADEQRFDLWVSVDKEDWEAHSREPLLRHGSFMGASLDEGRPLVFPRDKKKRPFQKRGGSRWKSFLVMPLPCDTSLKKYGAVAIDHTGNDAAFDSTRLEVVRDFTRYVEMLHTVSQEARE